MTDQQKAEMFHKHERLIGKFARKGHSRLLGVGVVIEFEDVFQEMCVAFVKAADKFNPDLGFQFSTYLGRAVLMEFNKFADRLIAERMELGMHSVDEIERDDDGDPYEGIVNYEGVSMEDALIARVESRERIAALNASERAVIRDLIKPSSELKTAFAAYKAQRDVGRLQRKAVIDAQRALNGKRVLPLREPEKVAEEGLRFIVKHHGINYRVFKRNMMKNLGVAL